MRWLALILATLTVGSADAAVPDFSTSAAIYEPAPAVAGDVLHYTVSVRNTGGDSAYTRITTSLPRGYFIRADGDCDAATLDQDTRKLVWHEGLFAAGSTKQCQIDLLSRREAAGTLAPLLTEITTVPAGYLEFEASPELATPTDPNAVRVGSINISRAGLAVIAFLAFVIVGGVIIMRKAKRDSAKPRTTLGAWFAVATAIGFLLYFLILAHEDYRSYAAYRETSCSIFDSTIQAFQGTGKSSRSSTYSPIFAVRYDALGTETYASAFPPTTAVSLGWIGYSQRTLDRFSVGSVHPCWFDPDDVRTVLLERGPGGAYFFALFPLITLAYGAWMLFAARRPGSARKAAALLED